MENLKSYLDGELDLAQKTEVETHVRNDAELQAMVSQFQVITNTLQTAEAGEPYGYDKLTERLTKAESSRRVENQGIWKKAAAWSMGAMACILISGILMNRMKSSSADEMSVATAASTSEATGIVPPQREMAKTSAGMSEESSPQTIEKKANSIGGAQDSFGSPSADEVYGRERTSEGDSKTENGVNESTPLSIKPVDGLGGLKDSSTAQYSDKNLSAKRAQPSSEISGASPAISGKALPESQFKSDMRTIRDRNLKGTNTLNDTPHGIYLERAGQIQIKVEDLMRSVDEATGMVQQLDGFVVNHQMENQEDGGTAVMTLKVPSKNYSTAMNKLQAMGSVISVNSASQDITTETVDNSTRMVSWADEEKRVMDLLEKAKTNDEKSKLRHELAEIRANLQSYRAVVDSLKQRADYSTINVTFLRGDKADKATPNGGSSNWSGNALRDAKSGLGSVWQILGTLLIYLGVFSPVWLPFLIAFVVIRKRS